uniref:Membrane protein n=1 Tax=Babesia bovis TaxID=5865 RepID=S6B8J8_BABBO|nr:membrane protein [Babesia bovis]
MMDTTTCRTVVLVLLWVSLCCQILGSLVAPIREYTTTLVLPTTTTLSTLLLGVCLWQCRLAGYLVSPMTWYHWVLLSLLVLLEEGPVGVEYLGLQGMLTASIGKQWAYPIYGIVVVLLGILGGTLYCGWKCNLFCRPCCKSQYICYGSAIVVVLVVITVLAVTALLAKSVGANVLGDHLLSFATGGDTEKTIINYLGNMAVPIMQCYTMAVLWNTTLKLPYTVLEVVALLTSALAVASMLALAVLGGTPLSGVKLSSKGYPFLAVHLVSLGITLYCLEYKATFCCSKQYLCLGLLVVVFLLALVVVAVVHVDSQGTGKDAMEYILLGYSLLLMVPTLWYAYRCGLLTWRWSFPKKKGLKATDTAENTAADTDIAKE